MKGELQCYTPSHAFFWAKCTLCHRVTEVKRPSSEKSLKLTSKCPMDLLAPASFIVVGWVVLKIPSMMMLQIVMTLCSVDWQVCIGHGHGRHCSFRMV